MSSLVGQTSFFVDTPENPNLDLSFERFVGLSPSSIFKCWTQPEHLMPWFCPLPWKTVACTVDLRKGGLFYTKMVSPEGESFEGRSVYLELEENRLIVWTSALTEGYRPAPLAPQTLDFHFTAVLRFTPDVHKGKKGTRYSARVLHRTPEDCAAHKAMDFEGGWGAALKQLEAYAQGKGWS